MHQSVEDQIRFFLGSNTRNGFVSYFDQLQNPRPGAQLILLKGGPGCGKSSTLRKVAAALETRGAYVEYFPCASDAQSLDAIALYDGSFAALDGTPPHVLEPLHPGAYETLIPLADALDESALRPRLIEIQSLCYAISMRHRGATARIAAACSLLDDTRANALPYIDAAGCDAFVEEIKARICDAPKGERRLRLLSAVSVDEVVFFEETVRRLCDTIYVLDDPLGAQDILTRIAHYARTNALSCIVCPSPLFGPERLDHILFPEIGFAITTRTPFHMLASTRVERIFTPYAQHITALLGDMPTIKTLIYAACAQVGEAKRLHDDLEHYYVSAMNFDKVAQMQRGILDRV